MAITEVQPQTDESAGTKQSGMFLRTMRVGNFRSCYDTTVDLRPDLTVLVGENNSGKSSVIDAIRLATAPLSGRRTRYFEESDFSHGREAERISLRLTFDGLTTNQQGLYHSALDPRDNTCIYTVRYKRPSSKDRYRQRPVFTSGPADGPDSDPDKREQICHVYLAPLRDAQKELDSSEGGRLSSIIELLTSDDEREVFVKDANDGLRGLNDHVLLSKTTKGVQGHVSGLTRAVRGQEVGIEFTDFSLRRLTRGLRLKMSEAGMNPANLAESGLGYASLVFIATVLLELQNAKQAELTIFLVEEPEAHLHPQLQAVLLEYLYEQAIQSIKSDAHGPAGRIQIVVTSHSPNLASSVAVESVVVMRSCPSPDASLGTPVACAVAIPVASIGLSNTERRKISQYLDATKASLLFARRVILVEGVSEAVLLPVIARRWLKDNQPDLAKHFTGVTVIPIGGVDFKPYIRLLLSKVGGVSILDKLVILTDGDPPRSDLSNSDASELIACRKKQLEDFAKALGISEALCVFPSTYTLEADLCTKGANLSLLKEAFLAQRPKSGEKWEVIRSATVPAHAFFDLLKREPDVICKGEFAHTVALALEDGKAFDTPTYLADAIKCALNVA